MLGRSDHLAPGKANHPRPQRRETNAAHPMRRVTSHLNCWWLLKRTAAKSFTDHSRRGGLGTQTCTLKDGTCVEVREVGDSQSTVLRHNTLNSCKRLAMQSAWSCLTRLAHLSALSVSKPCPNDQHHGKRMTLTGHLLELAVGAGSAGSEVWAQHAWKH